MKKRIFAIYTDDKTDITSEDITRILSKEKNKPMATKEIKKEKPV